MTIDSAAFRDALRHFPSGVTLVTLRSGGIDHGLTVSAFASVSPEPPLVAVMIDHQHRAYTLLEAADAVFAVNVLAEEQGELSNRFAWGPEDERFGIGSWTRAVTGAPILENALAWLDCRIYARHPAGTHSLYIGEVVASSVPRPEQSPLVYWNRDYRRLALALSADPPSEPMPDPDVDPASVP